MDNDERIRRFEELAAQDPSDMTFFGLAGAYAQAGRHGDAAEAYLKCVDVNPAMSKAYQLAGASLIEGGRPDEAAEVLTRGYAAAAEHGDMMPKKAMGELLQKLGRPVPEVRDESAPAPEPTGDFVCSKTGRPGHKLDRPPFKGAVGEWIVEHISGETWRDWVALGTKLINELRLDLSREDHSAVWDLGMRRYIGLSDETYRELTGEEPSAVGDEFVQMIDFAVGRAEELERYQGELHKGM